MSISRSRSTCSIETPAVGFVVDGEALAVAEAVRLRAQDPDARRVEGRNPHALRDLAEKLAQPMAHLVGRLVREGDREHLPWGVRVPIRPDTRSGA